MKQYVGIQTLMAVEMTLGNYNMYKGWNIPENEDPMEEGYFVEYSNGHHSWSPKEHFEKIYRSNGKYNFGHALWMMQQGAHVSRTGWNEKNMFLFLVTGSRFFLVPSSRFKVNHEPLLSILDENTIVDYRDHIDMYTSDGTIVPWTCSQTDMQSNDWVIVEKEDN